MIPVDQTIIDSTRGNCHQAVVASLLEVELIQVPHFVLYDGDKWFDVYYYFFKAFNYDYSGFGQPDKRGLKKEDSIGGYFDACVKSKTFPDKNHAVVIDLNGVVVHDPNPNKMWQDKNVLKSGELKDWYMFKKIEVIMSGE